MPVFWSFLGLFVVFCTTSYSLCGVCWSFLGLSMASECSSMLPKLEIGTTGTFSPSTTYLVKTCPVPKGKPFETLHCGRSIFNILSIEIVALFLINGRGFLWLIFLFVIALCFLNDVLTIPKLLRFFFHHFVQFWIRELNA